MRGIDLATKGLISSGITTASKGMIASEVVEIVRAIILWLNSYIRNTGISLDSELE